MEKSWNCVFEFLWEPWTVWNKLDLVPLAKCEDGSFSTYHIFFVCLIWFFTSQSTIFQLYWDESSWVKPALVFLKDMMQWRWWGSNPQPLDLEKALYQWTTVPPFITYAWSHGLRACAHEYDILNIICIKQTLCKRDFILKTGLDLSARQFESTRNPVGVVTNLFLTLLSAVSSADNLCKQFGPRSGPTKRRARSGSKLSEPLMVFLKEFFEKVNFEKNQQTTT